MAHRPNPRPESGGRRRWLRVLAALALIGGIVVVQRSGVIELGVEAIGSLGAWAPAAFVALHALTVVVLLPSIVPSFAAGALFGLVAGFFLSLAGAGLGALVALEIGRGFARERVRARFGRDPRFLALDRLTRERGWRIVALARLSPIIPFSICNYAFGTTPIRGRDYLFASVLGTIPSNAVYVYLGALAGEVSVLEAGGDARSPAEWMLLVVGLLATVALTLYLRRLVSGLLPADGEEPGEPESEPS